MFMPSGHIWSYFQLSPTTMFMPSGQVIAHLVMYLFSAITYYTIHTVMFMPSGQAIAHYLVMYLFSPITYHPYSHVYAFYCTSGHVFIFTYHLLVMFMPSITHLVMYLFSPITYHPYSHVYAFRSHLVTYLFWASYHLLPSIQSCLCLQVRSGQVIAHNLFCSPHPPTYHHPYSTYLACLVNGDCDHFAVQTTPPTVEVSDWKGVVGPYVPSEEGGGARERGLVTCLWQNTE